MHFRPLPVWLEKTVLNTLNQIGSEHKTYTNSSIIRVCKIYTPLTQTRQNATQTTGAVLKGSEGRLGMLPLYTVFWDGTGQSGAIRGEQHNAIQLN